MNNYFLKCDVSGIQNFIFNVPSKKAARELKKRSMYVESITEKCLSAFESSFEKSRIEKLYHGGGNFYLKIATEKGEDELLDFINTLNEEYREKDVFPYMAFIKNENQSVSDLLEAINKKVQKAKLQRPVIYEKYNTEFILTPTDSDLNNYGGINTQVPRDENGALLDFDQIAAKSTGDYKLAALKLDVDNLGENFRNRTESEYKKLSDDLRDFFDNQLLKLITEELKIKEHIYVVFSGGDDCFLIGCWDKVFELAVILRQKFDHFQKQLKIDVSSLQKNITFSAGIVVIPPAYPMIRLAEETENALKASKNVEGKNSVTVFGKTLSWVEFEKSQRIAGQLYKLITEKGEAKSLIERIKSSDIGFDSLQKDAFNGKVSLPKVWRLKYYLRNVKQENQDEVEKIFKEYTDSILKAFVRQQGTNPNTYPVAARWAELLLKEKEQL